MLKPEQVPDEVVAAARVAWLGSDVSAQEDWRSAIAAAINAWPGVGGCCVFTGDQSKNGLTNMWIDT